MQVGTVFNATNFTAYAAMDINGLNGSFPSLTVFGTNFTLGLNTSQFKIQLYAKSRFSQQNPWSLTASATAIFDMFGSRNMRYSGDFSAFAQFQVCMQPALSC